MILVALGANLPGPWGAQPIAACIRAARALDGLCGLRLVAVSPWYRSRPVPASEQPDYVNGVALLAGAAEPGALLAGLQAIEHEAGRVRAIRDSARTLDLDIVDMDGLLRDVPDPVLPHPRAWQRAFVLLPLLDVAPDWIEPRRRRAGAALLAELRDGCGEARAPLDWPVQYKQNGG